MFSCTHIFNETPATSVWSLLSEFPESVWRLIITQLQHFLLFLAHKWGQDHASLKRTNLLVRAWESQSYCQGVSLCAVLPQAEVRVDGFGPFLNCSDVYIRFYSWSNNKLTFSAYLKEVIIVMLCPKCQQSSLNFWLNFSSQNTNPQQKCPGQNQMFLLVIMQILFSSCAC